MGIAIPTITAVIQSGSFMEFVAEALLMRHSVSLESSCENQ
jgi:hypothetical protein